MAKIAAGYADIAGFDGSTQLTSTRANDTATNGGQILLNGLTGSRIDYANNGINPPAFNTRSTGTKICVWSSLDASNVDYAIGIANCSTWFSVPASAQGFNLYDGTTRMARLNGSGVLDAKGLSTTGNIYSSGNTNQVGALYIGTGGDLAMAE